MPPPRRCIAAPGTGRLLSALPALWPPDPQAAAGTEGLTYDPEVRAMNKACLEFGIRSFTADDVRGRTVLEVGSRDVNGSLRGHVEGLAPASYLGVDMVSGLGVDEICPV